MIPEKKPVVQMSKQFKRMLASLPLHMNRGEHRKIFMDVTRHELAVKNKRLRSAGHKEDKE